MPKIAVNGQVHELSVDPQTPLLWVLRDHLKLTGTRYGCGVGVCGACTVHLDGEPIRACLMPLEAVVGKQVTTIEGLSADASHPVQLSWRRTRVPQCGYCQSGQIMSAVALLREHPQPSDEQINVAMSGNLCRCGTYNRIRQAIHLAAELMGSENA